MSLVIRAACPADVPTILRFVRDLAAFERAPGAVVATGPMLHEALFGARPVAEAVIAEWKGTPAAFALFFHNFSTWEGRAGLYLEDLYVTPEMRGKGIGKALLAHLAGIAVDRNCARYEWAVLDWNQPAIDVYRSVGARGMDEWRIQRLEGDALNALAAESR